MIRAKLVYALLLGILVLFFILYRGALSVQLLILALLFPLLLRIVLLIQKLCISVWLLETEPTAHKGEPFSWIVQIRNRFPIPASHAKLDLEYRSSMSGKTQRLSMSVPVLGCNTEQLTLTFQAITCGEMRLTLRSLTVYDPFHLFSDRIRLRASRSVTVMPTVPEQAVWEPGMPQAEDASEYSKHKPGDDPSEIFDFHIYREGDMISRIHWKLSSKLDDLMVKEFSLPLAGQYLLFPDYRLVGQQPASSVLLDAACSAAAQIAAYMISQRLPVSMLMYPDDSGEPTVFPLHQDADFTEAMRALFACTPAKEDHFEAMVSLLTQMQTEGCIDLPVLFIPALTSEQAALLAELPRPEKLTVFAILTQDDDSLPSALPYQLISLPARVLLPEWEHPCLQGSVSIPEGGVIPL